MRERRDQSPPASGRDTPQPAPQAHNGAVGFSFVDSSACDDDALADAFMRCIRISDGLNTSTQRLETTAGSPVLGLRAILCPFLRTKNDPKDDSFTVSPRSRQSLISLSTDSTSFIDSAWESIHLRYTALHKSARFTVFPAMIRPLGCGLWQM
jgi:hypothetical protein